MNNRVRHFFCLILLIIAGCQSLEPDTDAGILGFAPDQIECIKIPARQHQLCAIVTRSPTGPFDDVSIYTISADKYDNRLLQSHSQQGSTFAGFHQSQSGKYVAFIFAEEGHPHFVIYEYQSLFELAMDARPHSVYGEYGVYNLVEINEDASLIVEFDWLDSQERGIKCLQSSPPESCYIKVQRD